jgi:Rod binding domain-containing protein
LAAELTVRPVGEAKAASEPQALETRAGHVRKVPDAAQKFEAFVLQSFIQEMMPDTAEGVYGAGISGDFWKSMMSEKIAEQVAERGSVGIADYVRAGHVAPVRPGGFSSQEVMSHIATLNGSLATPFDTTVISGD